MPTSDLIWRFNQNNENFNPLLTAVRNEPLQNNFTPVRNGGQAAGQVVNGGQFIGQGPISVGGVSQQVPAHNWAPVQSTTPLPPQPFFGPTPQPQTIANNFGTFGEFEPQPATPNVVTSRPFRFPAGPDDPRRYDLGQEFPNSYSNDLDQYPAITVGATLGAAASPTATAISYNSYTSPDNSNFNSNDNNFNSHENIYSNNNNDNSYYNSANAYDTSGELPTQTVDQKFNIIAELAKYSRRKNLISSGGHTTPRDPYIRYQSPHASNGGSGGSHGGQGQGMEVIMYPHGQLAQGGPAATTIGPKLQQFLDGNRRFSASKEIQNYQSVYDTKYDSSDSAKYDSFVLTKKNPEVSSSVDLAGVSESSGEEGVKSEGFFPKLWRSAKDDLKLVGDVASAAIKYALNRR